MAQEQGASIVLHAHHRRDQAETVLLQAMRGAGAAGLAAMPRVYRESGLAWCRPWLEQPREAIESYLRRHRLRSVDDPSNLDVRFARSRLRRLVWPTLVSAFPEAETALATVARRAQQALQLQESMAMIDRARLRDGDQLRVAPLLELDEARRINVLRAWLGERLGHAAPGSLLERLGSELPQAAKARWPVSASSELRLHRGRLSIGVGTAALAPAGDQAIDLSRPGVHPVSGWQGALVVRRVARGGVDAGLLCEAVLRSRHGGEQFQSHARGLPRSLKKQYQAAAVAAWDRTGPLVWNGSTLLFVPGLGIDARCRISGPGLSLRWVPAAGLLHRRS
jgi:tRNA(Ile)-lysidine synthase